MKNVIIILSIIISAVSCIAVITMYNRVSLLENQYTDVLRQYDECLESYNSLCADINTWTENVNVALKEWENGVYYEIENLQNDVYYEIENLQNDISWCKIKDSILMRCCMGAEDLSYFNASLNAYDVRLFDIGSDSLSKISKLCNNYTINSVYEYFGHENILDILGN